MIDFNGFFFLSSSEVKRAIRQTHGRLQIAINSLAFFNPNKNQVLVKIVRYLDVFTIKNCRSTLHVYFYREIKFQCSLSSAINMGVCAMCRKVERLCLY